MTVNGGLLGRLRRGLRWSWVSPAYRASLPADLDREVMGWRSVDRLHEKQGRSTCRVDLETPGGRLPVYLKRHVRLPRVIGLATVLDPAGRRSPAGAEFRQLEAARALGLRVPETVAAGESLGPWGRLQSYLLLKELAGQEALNEALPKLRQAMGAAEFEAWKRRLVAELAAMVALMHRAGSFHKDLYLCHFFVPTADPWRPGSRPTLIDLHRMARHRRLAAWYRWKDLGQLLFSTVGVPGIGRRDRLRFWVLYRRGAGLLWDRFDLRAATFRARRYLAHDRSSLGPCPAGEG